MTEFTLNKLKSTAVNCASTVLGHLNILAEESRLSGKYEALGRKLLPALEAGALETLKEDPEVVTLVGEIAEMQKRIRELKNHSQQNSQK